MEREGEGEGRRWGEGEESGKRVRVKRGGIKEGLGEREEEGSKGGGGG